MKRLTAIIISLIMLLGMTAVAETTETYEFGPFTFDAAGCVSCDYEAGDLYAIIDYDDFVVAIEYFELGPAGFDDAYFDSVAPDGESDTWETISLLLSIKYGPDMDNKIHEWYEEEPIETTGYNPEGRKYNGQTIADLGGGRMAGMAFYHNGGLLLFECITFGNDDLETMQGYRAEMLEKLYYNGTPVLVDTASPIVPSVNPFANIIGGATAAPSVTVPDSDAVYGSYVYDVSDSVEYDIEDDTFMFVDYGTRVVRMEHGTFAMYDSSYEELSDMYGGDMTPQEMANLLFENSNFVEPGHEMYNVCSYEEAPADMFPAGIYFNGTVTDEYGGGVIAGAILVTEDEIIFLECISVDPSDTLADMQEFRESTLNKLYYNGTPVR